MPFPPSWLLSWLLNEVAECGGAGTELPNFDFAIAVVARGWPSRVPCLPAIVHDYVMSLYGNICLFNGCESVVELVVGLLRVMIPSASDGTMWWRVDDLWWSFLSAWSLPCLANFASWAVHEHLVSYVVLLSHPLVMPSFCPFFCGSWHFVWTFCSIHYFIPTKD